MTVLLSTRDGRDGSHGAHPFCRWRVGGKVDFHDQKERYTIARKHTT